MWSSNGSEVIANASMEAPAAVVTGAAVIEPYAPLERAVVLMCRHQTDVLPVVQDGRLVGMIAEEDLPSDAGAARDERVAERMRPASVIVAPATVAKVLAARASFPATTFAVATEAGEYLGVVRLREVLAQASRYLRPPRVGGMATPFGVHLHCGTAMAGASHVTLVVTGVLMGVLAGLAWIVVYCASWLGDTVFHGALASLWTEGGALADPAHAWMGRVQFVALLLVILLLLRLSHVSQYHAAEHMVVHAIERGEPLTVEAAARMSRVHARCGSNLVVVLVIVMLALTPPFDWRWALLAMVLLPWSRRLGALAQRYFATRPPRAKHLRAALRSADLLLQRYAAAGRRAPSILGRIWFSGLVHVFAGLAVAYGVWSLVERLLMATVAR